MTKPAICLLLISALSKAQQPPATAGASRLDQMEAIYQKELSARHIPLLGKYLTELQRQASTASAEDQPFYTEEISRIQQVISAGGVLDLISAQQSPDGRLPMPAPMPAPSAAEPKDALIVLAPAQARRMSPAAAKDAGSAAVSEAEWDMPAIAAGTYDILLHYSSPALTTPLPIKITFAGQTVEKVMEPDRATKDAQSFRIIRLGSLTLTGDHRDETLQLSAGGTSQAVLHLKSVLIMKPRQLLY